MRNYYMETSIKEDMAISGSPISFTLSKPAGSKDMPR